MESVSIPSNRGKPSDALQKIQEAGIPMSQSPQIGASLRTHGACVQSVDAICLNPLKSGQAFGPHVTFTTLTVLVVSQSPQIGASLRTNTELEIAGDLNEVSIPSNRGKPSDPHRFEISNTPTPCLNPLKSGQAFGPTTGSSPQSQSRWSQSPQIGASLRTPPQSLKPAIEAAVSIPSNRGKPSDTFRQGSCRKEPSVSIPSNRGKPSDGRGPSRNSAAAQQSQSPQIGASLRTWIMEAVLQGGTVSIPSNRGKPSDKSNLGERRGAHKVSIPSNRGKPSDPCWTRRCGNHARSLNPLKSGQAFGLMENLSHWDQKQSLNPLKSGQAFGRILGFYFAGKEKPSQSPQIGASLRTHERRP